MSRPHYTDPLSAIWMFSKFGMDMTAANGEPILNSFIRNQFPSSGKWYIDVDRLYLLEPQVGDLTEAKEGHGVGTHYFIASESDLEHLAWDNDLGLFGQCRIVERNGIAFMWPQSE